jgi:hypothetical protein
MAGESRQPCCLWSRSGLEHRNDVTSRVGSSAGWSGRISGPGRGAPRSTRRRLQGGEARTGLERRALPDNGHAERTASSKRYFYLVFPGEPGRSAILSIPSQREREAAKPCPPDLPPPDRFAVVLPQRGKMKRANLIFPLWGRSAEGAEGASDGQAIGKPPTPPQSREQVFGEKRSWVSRARPV